MTRVKICGITNKDDALAAAKLGAWALGFIFYKQSPRYVSPFKAKKIIDELPPFVTPVGVFVNLKEGAVMDIAEFCGISTLQLHGDESPQYCRRLKKFKLIKAFRVKEDFNISGLGEYPVSAYLFDGHEKGVFGGTGKTFDWEVIKDKKIPKPVILSGGLSPENVAGAVRGLSPYAVDVSSGVEKEPGKKDYGKMEIFLRNLE